MTEARIIYADEDTFWPNFSWAEIAALPHKDSVVVVVPVAGMADWGLGAPLYLEEIVLSAVLRQASLARGDLPLLVTPPVRFVVGPGHDCAFPLPPPAACALLEEVVLSVKASGFTKVVLLNSSPFNEELCDAVARDLRIAHGMQMFCVNMSALGLDLDPTRNPDRRPIAALFVALDGSSPGDAPLAALDGASVHLAALLREVHGRPPLPQEGRMTPVPAP